MRVSVAVTGVFVAVMVSTNLPTPLYAIYVEQLSVGPFWITAAYGVGSGVLSAICIPL